MILYASEVIPISVIFFLSMFSSVEFIDLLLCSGLLEIVRGCTYVGMADDVFALLQYQTHLYLVNVVNLRY